MVKVFFQDSKGNERFLESVENKQYAFRAINDFLNEHNYKSYYMRTWLIDDDTRLKVDVGSHTEFFILEGDVF